MSIDYTLNEMLRTLRILKAGIEELEGKIESIKAPMNECAYCDHWDKQQDLCGLYKQRPPEHVTKEPWKYCNECTTIPF